MQNELIHPVINSLPANPRLLMALQVINKVNKDKGGYSGNN